MANNLVPNPKFVDTAATVFATGERVHLRSIAWLSDQASGSDIAADDDFLLSDGGGNRIIGKRAEAVGDGLIFEFPDGYIVNGLVVTTLDGGVVYIFV